MVQVKALACELPHRLGLPLSRLSIADIRQVVVAQSLVAEISGTTLWRGRSERTARAALPPAWRRELENLARELGYSTRNAEGIEAEFAAVVLAIATASED